MAPTELDFGDSRDDFGELWMPEQGLDAWLESRGVPPVHLSVWSGRALEGFGNPTKLGGVVVHGASTVLGIRAWDDAYEGVLTANESTETIPWVLFDLEKIVRMMLRQSGLAFEILASPLCASSELLGAETIPVQAIIEAAIHQDILLYYRDRADAVRWDAEELESGEYRLQILDAVRNALTGLRLVDGQVLFGLADLLEHVEDDVGDAVRALLADDTLGDDQHDLIRDRVSSWVQLLEIPGTSVLGNQPDDYDWLHEFVVEQRLKSRDS